MKINTNKNRLKNFLFVLRSWNVKSYDSINSTNFFGQKPKVYIQKNQVIKTDPQFSKNLNKTFYVFDICNFKNDAQKTFFIIIFENVNLDKDNVANLKKVTELSLIYYNNSAKLGMNQKLYKSSLNFKKYLHLPNNIFFENQKSFLNTEGFRKKPQKRITRKNAKKLKQGIRKFKNLCLKSDFFRCYSTSQPRYMDETSLTEIVVPVDIDKKRKSIQNLIDDLVKQNLKDEEYLHYGAPEARRVDGKSLYGNRRLRKLANQIKEFPLYLEPPANVQTYKNVKKNSSFGFLFDLDEEQQKRFNSNQTLYTSSTDWEYNTATAGVSISGGIASFLSLYPDAPETTKSVKSNNPLLETVSAAEASAHRNRQTLITNLSEFVPGKKFVKSFAFLCFSVSGIDLARMEFLNSLHRTISFTSPNSANILIPLDEDEREALIKKRLSAAEAEFIAETQLKRIVPSLRTTSFPARSLSFNNLNQHFIGGMVPVPSIETTTFPSINSIDLNTTNLETIPSQDSDTNDSEV